MDNIERHVMIVFLFVECSKYSPENYGLLLGIAGPIHFGGGGENLRNINYGLA